MSQSEKLFLEQLYNKTYYPLKKYVEINLHSQEVEDVLQETYIEAFKNINKLLEHENPTGWIFIACKNVILRYKSKNYKSAEYSFLTDFGEESVNNIPASHDDYGFILHDELKKILSDEEYFLLVTRYIKGFSIAKLAEQMNIAEGACKMRIKRALEKARKKIKIYSILLLLFINK